MTVPSYPLFSLSLSAFRVMDLDNPPASASQVALSIGTYQGSYVKVAFWRVVSQVWFLLLQSLRPPAPMPSAGVCSCITLVQTFISACWLGTQMLLVQTDTSMLLYTPRTETGSCYVSLAGLGLCASQVNFKLMAVLLPLASSAGTMACATVLGLWCLSFLVSGKVWTALTACFSNPGVMPFPLWPVVYSPRH